MTVRLSLYATVAALLIGLLGACGGGEQGGTEDDASASMALPTASHPDTTGWTPLFQPDLSDAVLDSSGSWAMENGVLAANDRTTIWTPDSYGDFVLDFEARAPDGTNSGLFFRTADRSNILSALELQMHNPPGPDSTADAQHRAGGKNAMGALYDLKGAAGGTTNSPDGWDRFTVTARDSMIYVVMNGEQVHEVDLSQWTEPGQTPDGESHKFDRALADQAERGPIGLQGIHSENGVSVEYRNLKIRRLDE